MLRANSQNKFEAELVFHLNLSYVRKLCGYVKYLSLYFNSYCKTFVHCRKIDHEGDILGVVNLASQQVFFPSREESNA